MHGVVSHERLELLDPHAVSDVKDGAFLDLLASAATDDLHVYIEVEVQMCGAGLHAPNPALSIERWTTTLATQARR